MWCSIGSVSAQLGENSSYGRNADEGQVEWKTPDTEGLVEFLCRDKGFK